jgi:hypothetical protein
MFVVLSALTLLAYAPAVADQASSPGQASPAASAGQAQSQTASGELVSVDTKAKTLTVKTSTGESKFSFDDSTKISGGKDAAGLATMSGSQVTIQYKKDGASNLATSIDLKAK